MSRKIIVLLLLTALILISSIKCQEKLFYIEKEWCLLSIEKSGDVFLLYNITVKVIKGSIKSYVSIGIPCPDFSVLEAYELETGAKLKYKKTVDRSSGTYLVTLYVSKPIYAGEARTFILRVILENFIYEDKTNPGNVGLLFKPCWWDPSYFSGIGDLRVKVVLPEDVEKNEVKCTPSYDNVFTEEGRVALYWERRNLPAEHKFSVGVSFPKKYVEKYVSLEEEEGFEDLLEIIVTLFVLTVIALCFIASFIGFFAKSTYEKPAFMIEALGPRKGLTAVEAAYLIMKYRRRRDYGRILCMILFGMIKKGFARILSYEPLRIWIDRDKYRLMRSYERAFADAVLENGEIDSRRLVKVFRALDRSLRTKMRGYCVKETVEYYEDIVKRAWEMVEEARLPEERFKTLAENLEWLLLDEEFSTRIRHVPEVVVRYDPYWDTYYWWYWRSLPLPQQPAEEVSLVRVADNIATAVEKTTSEIASRIEEVADKITRIFERESESGSRSTSSRSYSDIGCVCACVSCACVCACVSCACACASGGAG
ncbi:MAG: hypothetical protein DRJ52_05560 [Thermoprotei archaeon]|nr:MAG: hypothetical protein DRJ52_05560 [Thermoprotei archaeon]RLE99789.1 MAG: hypothetical protein DRJ63_04225 [Thermoprotei archaeon]